MKKLKVIILSIAIIGMFSLPLNVMADELLKTNEAADGETSLQDTVKDENTDNNLENISSDNEKNQEVTTKGSQEETVNKVDPESTLSGGEEQLEKSMMRSPQPTEEKTFTVTKYPVGQPEDKELVGEYDTFYSAVDNCKQEHLESQYVITMNKDYTVPADEAMWSRSNVNMLIRSKDGNKFTLKREGIRDLISVNKNVTLNFENIILDGNNQIELMSAFDNAVLTIGKGTTVQNCRDTTHFDGPAIYLSGQSTLNIEEGAVIQNNISDKQGGAIQGLSGTTINIYGGTFQNNKTNKSDGGAIAAYGKLNITGGLFENNAAKKTGGAIMAGSRADATIKNATFKNNQAGTGGAMYSANNISISDSSFENNQANWGGAIFAGKGIDLTNVTFNENKVAYSGGALYLSSGEPKLNNCKFNKNLTKAQGGAIYIKTANTTITESTFTGNYSGAGAIFVNHNNNGTTRISKTSFADNFSSSFGGGVYLGMNSKLEVTQSSFSNNQAAYGAGISSSGIGDLDTNLTNIKVENTTFEGNKSLMGAGIFTSFPTEIVNSSFTNNEAIVNEKDDKTNPHFSGVGGAMEIIDNKTVIKGSTFEKNTAYGSGGAIGINGVTRDNDGKIVDIKENIKVEISENTKFILNTCKVGQGGAIYTIPYLYDLGGQEISAELLSDFKDKAYKNLTTDDTTLFKGNKSEIRLFNPPINYLDFTNLQFSEKSDIPHNKYMSKSLLNNYDINYKGGLLIIYDANGGKFSDGTQIKQELHQENDIIKIIPAPTREGYKFLYWKGSEHYPGQTYTVTNSHTFVAQWNKKPELEVKDATINEGDEIDLRTLIIKARDEEDGENLIDKVVIDKGNFDSKKAGKYKITFTLTDSNGESVTKTATVTVNKKEDTPDIPEPPTPEAPTIEPQTPQIVSQVEKPSTKVEQIKGAPQTDDANEVMIYAMLTGLSSIIVAFVYKKKKYM